MVLRSVYGVWLFVGVGLITKACDDSGVALHNRDLEQLSFETLASEPLESPRWVEVVGIPVAGSYFAHESGGYLLLKDAQSGVTVYVDSPADSSLRNQNVPTTLRGMAVPFEEVEDYPSEYVPDNIQATPILISENATPPGWWTILTQFLGGWLFILLEFAAMANNSQ